VVFIGVTSVSIPCRIVDRGDEFDQVETYAVPHAVV
jgi:hypothetical protein